MDKVSLTPETLKEVIQNGHARAAAALGLEDLRPEQPLSHQYPNFNLNRFEAPLEYLESGIHALIDVLDDSNAGLAQGYLFHLMETTRAMKTYASSDLTEQSTTPLHDVLFRMYNHVGDLARAKSVGLSFDLETAWFSQVGSRVLAQLGIQHLLEGTIRSCVAGDRVLVRAEKDGTDLKLMVHINRSLFHDLGFLFGKPGPLLAVGLDARSSMHLGSMLLSLRPEQVSLSPVGPGEQITITLS